MESDKPSKLKNYVAPTERQTTVYIYKYWATKGIELADVRIVNEVYASKRFLFTKEWTNTYEEACDKVAKLAERKIKSLEKSLEHIKAIRQNALDRKL